jgi:UDP-N-acetylglucosamine:LPS N-acetylglucosamine transferase
MELTHLFPAFDGRTVEYATADPGRASDVAGGRINVLADANQRTPWRLLICAAQTLRLVMSVRPRVVLTTGAAPGLLAIVFGKLAGARTVWIDTVAGVERMTLSGRLARRFTDVYLVQWPHLARPNGPYFRGSVL